MTEEDKINVRGQALQIALDIHEKTNILISGAIAPKAVDLIVDEAKKIEAYLLGKKNA